MYIAVVYIVIAFANGQGDVNHIIGFMMAAGNTYGKFSLTLSLTPRS
jgi:hypothetical protein